MEERSIRIELAGRAYPLTIGVAEEGNVQRAANEINESIASLKDSHPLIDRQDLLAMAALEVTVRALNQGAAPPDTGTEEAIGNMERMLSEAGS